MYNVELLANAVSQPASRSPDQPVVILGASLLYVVLRINRHFFCCYTNCDYLLARLFQGQQLLQEEKDNDAFRVHET